MDSVYAGVLSLIPPILTMAFAMKSKNIIFSLMSGALSGALIYVILTGQNIFLSTFEVLFETMTTNIDMYIVLFCFFLGAIIQILKVTGATHAYGEWMGKRLKSRRATLISSWALGILTQVDDYFHCLTVGIVMRPLAERFRISKEKLSYIIDAMGASVCVLSPISSWSVAVASTLFATGIFENGFSAFVSTIPFNMYAWLTIIMAFMIAAFQIDFGKMKIAEEKELNRKEEVNAEVEKVTVTGHASDVFIVILTLIFMAVIGMLYTGGFWGTDSEFAGEFIKSLGNCNAGKALCWSGFISLCVAGIRMLSTKAMDFTQFMDESMEGLKSMLDIAALLILSWTLSAVCRDLLLTPIFVKNVLTSSNIIVQAFPAIMFLCASLLSFSMGSAWGTFFIFLPIVAPVVVAMEPKLLLISLGATLGGSVFGDHCSPISDTTILSSVGTGCNHLSHVETQIPYAILVGFSSFIGYIFGGFTMGNLTVTLITSLVTLAVGLVFLSKREMIRNTVLKPHSNLVRSILNKRGVENR